jgi:hypothetical protein
MLSCSSESDGEQISSLDETDGILKNVCLCYFNVTNELLDKNASEELKSINDLF